MNTDMTYTVYNQSCIEGMMEHVKDDSIDLIFTDPPYGINGDELDVHYHRDESNVVPGYVDVPLSQYSDFSNKWIAECERVLRPGGSMYIVSGYTNLHHILNSLHATNLVEVNHLIAQYKFSVYTKNKWVSSHYHVLFWQKKDRGNQKRTFNSECRFSEKKDSYNDRLSVQELPRGYKPGQIKNKNQLDESFIEKFILYSSNRGDMVLDPFCGGFTTGRSALRYGRNFTGFELNKNAYDVFYPTLQNVQVLADPVPIDASPEEIEKREKMRQTWRNDRKKRKGDTGVAA